MTRTRLGKVVGSVRTTDPNGWRYWSEKNWETGEDGFVTVAPSGARFNWYATEAEAQADVERENAEWFAVSA